MSKTATYALIESQTLGSLTNSVTFSNIPGTYVDLILVISGTSVGPSDCGLRFNSDTGSNYSHTRILGNGTSASSAMASNTTFAQAGTLYTTQVNFIISIQDYSNTTTYKTLLSRINSSANHVASYVAMWRSTNAITSVQFYSANDNISIGTTFRLYGIQAGNA